MFDLNLPLAKHPPDVQVYLYLIGADHPTEKGDGWSEAIEAGLKRLRTAQARGEGTLHIS